MAPDLAVSLPLMMAGLQGVEVWRCGEETKWRIIGKQFQAVMD